MFVLAHATRSTDVPLAAPPAWGVAAPGWAIAALAASIAISGVAWLVARARSRKKAR